MATLKLNGRLVDCLKSGGYVCPLYKLSSTSCHMTYMYAGKAV